MFHRFARLVTDPEVDAAWQPHSIEGIAFYFTLQPNLRFDITDTRERKHRALDAYRAQFTPEGLAFLHRGLESKEREWAEGEAYAFAEPLRVLRPGHLHVNLDAGVG